MFSRKRECLVRKLLPAVTLIFAASMFAAAQTQAGVSVAAKTSNIVRTTKAMHYRQGGTVKVDFQGTELMSSASGEAKVEGKKTNIEIDAKCQGLEDSSKFGLEYPRRVAP
jgi:hypothetical protein